MAKRSADISTSRWTDKLVPGMAIIIGALSTIIWGIIWTQVATNAAKVATLEGDKRVIEVQLIEMKGTLDRIERAMERQKERDDNKSEGRPK